MDARTLLCPRELLLIVSDRAIGPRRENLADNERIRSIGLQADREWRIQANFFMRARDLLLLNT